MAIATMIDNPNGSKELYDKLVEQLELDGKPAGGILHIAGPSPDGGWRVIEVWESEEAAQQFVGERLRSAFEAVGAPAPPPVPEIWSVHSYLT